MATENSGPVENSDPNHLEARKKGSRAANSLAGPLRDKVLLTSWIFSYAIILWIFGLMKKFENRSALRKRKNP